MRVSLFLLATVAGAFAADEIGPPPTAATGPSADAAVKTFAVAPGLRVETWASEPLFENPVAFAFDNLGRAYVAETHRRRSSTLDIRRNEDWVSVMLGFRTVADRVAFLKTELAPEKKVRASATRPDLNGDGQFDWRDLMVEGERIRVLEDRDGDGRAEQTHVLAEGFADLATGTGAGVLPLPGGDVLYTCIPDLWRITPDGTKKSLSTGYGVHVAYSGHDMHGLRMGPDGRVYFTIADCGASIAGADGRAIECPDSGAVFRCWPDGRDLELFAKGMRNPQHLAFNDVGDLFTADNNADGGDKARLIHVIEGADYGWRIGWQFLPKLGAWNSEGMWHLDAGEQNAAILPPIAYLGHGPAGFSYYPGTGLPEKYRGHFFMADFPGGVRTIKLQPKGASYAVDGFAGDAAVLQSNAAREMTGKLLWNLDPSDVQFAPGAGVYVLDWTRGWEKTGKGRIYRVFAPELEKDAEIARVKQLLGSGIAEMPIDQSDDLKKWEPLLDHADQRVRLAAQFKLVEAGAAALLMDLARHGHGLARLHAIWGLGQLENRQRQSTHKKTLQYLNPILALFEDPDAEVRAQMAKVCGDFRYSPSQPYLRRRVVDESPRVRLAAAAALGRFQDPEAIGPLYKAVEMLQPGEDPLRYTLALALSRCRKAKDVSSPREKKPAQLTALVELLADRFQQRPNLADWLAHTDARLRLEAARAIHDTPVPAALPALAELAGQPTFGEQSDVLARRVVNANYRLGDLASAQRLAKIAANDKVPIFTRRDALDALGQWTSKGAPDRMLGIVVPGDGARQRGDAASALVANFDPLISGPSPIAVAALQVAEIHRVKELEPLCYPIANGQTQGAPLNAEIRAAALRVLNVVDSPHLAETLQKSLEAVSAAPLREAARRIQANRKPGDALAEIAATLKKGELAEQRAAIDTLGLLDLKGADELLAHLLYKMKIGNLPASLHLDVLEAAMKRTDSSVLGMVKEWDQKRAKKDPLANWRECLEGGDAQLGRAVFAEKAEAACLRCHAVNKQGGDVGPDLAAIGTKGREYLLRAIVEPNAEIAPGYDNVLVTLQNGDVAAGLAAAETAETLTLRNPADGKSQVIKKVDIKERQKLPSAMPPALGEVLGKRALRDIMEYLSTLK